MDTNLIRLAIRDLSRTLQEDEGDIEFLGVSDKGVVKIKFVGACVGCPMSSLTVKNFIELNLKRKFPEVEKVIAVKA